jgi:hypothetical protein
MKGASENRSRPSDRPPFRSAAASRRRRLIAAVLSGLLDVPKDSELEIETLLGATSGIAEA